MIRKYTLEILDGDDLTGRNYFGYTKKSFSLNGFNETSDKDNNECIRAAMLNKTAEAL